LFGHICTNNYIAKVQQIQSTRVWWYLVSSGVLFQSFLCLHNTSVKTLIGLIHDYRLITSSPWELQKGSLNNVLS
jgi:hypothetical protein